MVIYDRMLSVPDLFHSTAICLPAAVSVNEFLERMPYIWKQKIRSFNGTRASLVPTFRLRSSIRPVQTPVMMLALTAKAFLVVYIVLLSR